MRRDPDSPINLRAVLLTAQAGWRATGDALGGGIQHLSCANALCVAWRPALRTCLRHHPQRPYRQQTIAPAHLSLQEIAQALSYLHSQDIIHSDLTPNNVLLLRRPPPPGDPRPFCAKVRAAKLCRICSWVADTFLPAVATSAATCLVATPNRGTDQPLASPLPLAGI